MVDDNTGGCGGDKEFIIIIRQLFVWSYWYSFLLIAFLVLHSAADCVPDSVGFWNRVSGHGKSYKI